MKLPLHLFLIALLLLAAAIAAGGKTDFSGAYTLTKIKGGEFGVGPEKGTVWGLEVVQTATAIVVTKVRTAEDSSILFHWMAQRASTTIQAEIRALAKAILREGISTWIRLSFSEPRADLKTLTIQNDVESAYNQQIVPNNILPWSEAYAQN